MADQDSWQPGSFTKNFSWGPTDRGLKELYDIIKVGFDNQPIDVPRSLFRERVQKIERPDYIPLNFFLLNRIKNGTDFVLVDELVYHAIKFRHTTNFDKLAVFAFNCSYVGHWKKATRFQNRPALWAHHYIADRISGQLDWDTNFISADDIEAFVRSDSRYRETTSRKLATNLAYLYKAGRLRDYSSKTPDRWWIAAVFLALDRVTDQRSSVGSFSDPNFLEDYLISSRFHEISGRRSIQKDLALRRYIDLYRACGGRERFDVSAVDERQKVLLPKINSFDNDISPIGVFHPSNIHAIGAVPKACAMLAHYIAEFEYYDIDLENPDLSLFIRSRTAKALSIIKERNLSSKLSVEQILSMTRGE